MRIYSLYASFLLLLGYFHWVDIYHQHFYETGLSLMVYQAARVYFIFCFMWVMYATGDLLLSRASSSYKKTNTLSSWILGFLAGIGLWQILLFALGLLGLLNNILLSLLSFIFLLAALPRLKRFTTAAYTCYWPGLLLISLPLGIFLLTKGTYPAGGHDYFNHYFHFYHKVVETGSLYPNAVWYHFYYSKGAGLFFYGMLLTDPLAPQLISAAMILVTALMIINLLNKDENRRWWAWFTAALYIAFLIYTPGPLENLRQGGWGDLEKPHEPAAALMFAVLWLLTFINHERLRQATGTTLLLTVAGLVLFSPMTAYLLGAFLMLYIGYLYLSKQRQSLLWMVLAVFTAGFTLATLWVVNYALTGIIDDQNIFLHWSLIDFKKVYEWGITFELFNLHWMKTELALHKTSYTFEIIYKWIASLRLDIWWGLLVSFLLIALPLRLFSPNYGSHKVKSIVGIFGGFLFFITIFLFFVGRDQGISLYRFTTFAYAPMLVFCMALIMFYLPKTQYILLSITVAGLLFFYSAIYSETDKISNYRKDNMVKIVRNSVALARGKISLYDAYQHQEGWPGRLPWGGIYQPMAEAFKQLPPHTRVWSLHVHSYCMVPDCQIETFMSYRLSPNANLVYYGDPLQSKRVLKRENLNYFFFSPVLQLTDPLPLSPLFSPKNIAQYLGIAWTDGENYLLTWKENATQLLDDIWLKRYEQKVYESDLIKTYPYLQINQAWILLMTRGKVRQNQLPWSIQC